MWKDCILLSDTGWVCLYIVSENVNNSCSLITLHPYSANVIVAIVCPGFSELMSKTDWVGWWHYYIVVIPLRKGKVDDVSGHLCEH